MTMPASIPDTPDATRTERLEKQFREDWFSEHEATKRTFFDIDEKLAFTELLWKEPGTGAYCVIYVLRGGQLFVAGDLGEAVYQWYGPVSLESIAGMGYSYFLEKCQASEVGQNFVEWDTDGVARNVKERILDTDYVDNDLRIQLEGLIRDHCYLTAGESITDDNLDEFVQAHTETKESWLEFLNYHGDECFGDDHWEWTYSVGEVIHKGCMAHLYGLKMAFRIAVNPSPVASNQLPIARRPKEAKL